VGRKCSMRYTGAANQPMIAGTSRRPAEFLMMLRIMVG
jgi:hypothetical protein